MQETIYFFEIKRFDIFIFKYHLPSSLRISAIRLITRMTHQKKKRNGTCIWSALLLTLSTAAPSTATTLTGLGLDRASAIVQS